MPSTTTASRRAVDIKRITRSGSAPLSLDDTQWPHLASRREGTKNILDSGDHVKPEDVGRGAHDDASRTQKALAGFLPLATNRAEPPLRTTRHTPEPKKNHMPPETIHNEAREPSVCYPELLDEGLNRLIELFEINVCREAAPSFVLNFLDGLLNFRRDLKTPNTGPPAITIYHLQFIQGAVYMVTDVIKDCLEKGEDDELRCYMREVSQPAMHTTRVALPSPSYAHSQCLLPPKASFTSPATTRLPHARHPRYAHLHARATAARAHARATQSSTTGHSCSRARSHSTLRMHMHTCSPTRRACSASRCLLSLSHTHSSSRCLLSLSLTHTHAARRHPRARAARARAQHFVRMRAASAGFSPSMLSSTQPRIDPFPRLAFAPCPSPPQPPP